MLKMTPERQLSALNESKQKKYRPALLPKGNGSEGWNRKLGQLLDPTGGEQACR